MTILLYPVDHPAFWGEVFERVATLAPVDNQNQCSSGTIPHVLSDPSIIPPAPRDVRSTRLGVPTAIRRAGRWLSVTRSGESTVHSGSPRSRGNPVHSSQRCRVMPPRPPDRGSIERLTSKLSPPGPRPHGILLPHVSTCCPHRHCPHLHPLSSPPAHLFALRQRNPERQDGREGGRGAACIRAGLPASFPHPLSALSHASHTPYEGGAAGLINE